MGQRERKNNFGVMRLIGAVMVIWGHMYVLTGQTPPMFMWESIHGFGVAVFFAIGGYLITKSWMRRPVFKEYIVKRIFRIFPALIACVLLTVFVVGPLMTSIPLREYFSSLLTWKYLLNGVLYINHLLPGVFENNIASTAVNGSLWCLPVEFLMYLAVPVYVGIGMKLSDRWQKWYYGTTTMLVILARVIWDTWLCGNGIFVETSYFSQVIIGLISSTIRIIPYFFVGSFFAVGGFEKLLNVQTAVMAVMLASALFYLSTPFCYVAEYLLIPYVVLAFSLADKPAFVVFNKRDISYGMFLSGHVIQQILIQIAVQKGYTIHIWLLIILSIGFSVVMGFLTERLIEKPAGKWMDRIILSMAKEE